MSTLPLLLAQFFLAQDSSSTWIATGALNTPRSHACAAPLPGGRALVAGGVAGNSPLSAVEIYGPDDLFHAAPDMGAPRVGHSCTALTDGRVLVVGGDSAELFDPDSGSWTPTANLPLPRRNHTATLLPDGSVLIAGGEDDFGLPSLERFDPYSNTFTILNSYLLQARVAHAAAALLDGRVLIVGGSTEFGEELDSTELISITDDLVVAGPTLPQPTAHLTASTLSDGRVLLAGGSSAGVDLATTTWFDPLTNTLASGPLMQIARSAASAIVIPGNGNVLMIGGVSNGMPSASTELYDVPSGMFAAFGDLTLARAGIAATPIGETGGILAAGGDIDGAAVAGCGKTNPNTLTPDNTFYLSGQTATITGSWPRKEIIAVSIQTFAATGLGISTTTRTVTNDSGTFTFQINSLTAGRKLVITATGQSSAGTASTSFLVGVSDTISLSVSPAASAFAPAAVTFNIHLHPSAPNGGPVSGSFLVRNGNTVITSATTATLGSFHTDSNGDGIATLTPVQPLAAGVYSFTVQFIRNPDGFAANSSTASPIAYTVARPTPQMIAAPVPFVSRVNGDITLRVTLTSPNGGPLPTGSATISELGISLFSISLTPQTGLGLTPAAVGNFIFAAGNSQGSRTFQIHYSGDSVYQATGTSVIAELFGILPKLDVTGFSSLAPALPNTVRIGDRSNLRVRLTATPGFDPLVDAFSGAPPNTVEVALPGQPVVQFPGRQVSPGGDLEWSMALGVFSSIGPSIVSIHYGGSTYYDSRTTTFTANVVRGTAVYTVATSAAPSGTTGAIIKVTVQDQCAIHFDVITGGCVAPITPSGSFQLFEGGAPLGTKFLNSGRSAVDGTSTVLTFFAPASRGTHTYVLIYSGDDFWEPRTVSLPVTIQ